MYETGLQVTVEGATAVFNWTALARSSALESPFLALLPFLGKTISLDWYSLSLWTLSCKDSNDLLVRLWSTAIPTVRAKVGLIPAAFNSSKVNPRPSLTFELYYFDEIKL